MKHELLWSATFVLLLSACATGPNYKAQEQSRQMFNDRYPNAECRYEATKATGMGALQNYYRDVMYNMEPFDEVYRQCVALKK